MAEPGEAHGLYPTCDILISVSAKKLILQYLIYYYVNY